MTRVDPTRAGEPIIRFDGVSKTFAATSRDAKAVHAVDGVSLDIYRGEVYGVIGYSGAGKSTLVRLINGLERASAGRVVVDGREVSAMSERQLRPVRTDIGMIFQQFNLFNSKTVVENIAYPLRLDGMGKDAARARVAELLDFVGLADKAGSYPDQLSGGQKQRVGIARALAREPKILLADEATSALDPETTRDVLQLLRRVNEELGITIVVITHAMDVVKYICDRVAVMEYGKVVEVGEVYDLFSRPREAVTKRFVGSALRDKPDAEQVRRIQENHAGRLVAVGIDDKSGGSATRLFETLSRHGVDGAIVYGSITEIQDRPFGTLSLALTGREVDIEAAIDELRTFAPVDELDPAVQEAQEAAALEAARREDLHRGGIEEEDEQRVLTHELDGGGTKADAATVRDPRDEGGAR